MNSNYDLSTTINKVIIPYNVFNSQEIEILLEESKKHSKTFLSFLINSGVVKLSSEPILNTLKKGYLKMDPSEVMSLFDKEQVSKILKSTKNNSISKGTKPLLSFDDDDDENINFSFEKNKEIKIGMVLGNKYEIIKELGRGATSNVYLVKHKLLKTYYALKLLSPSLIKDMGNINIEEIFLDEAINSAQLSHPNLVKVFDAEKDHNHTYMVMEYIDGTTLQELLEVCSPISIQESIDIVIKVCQALKYSLENGIIHRDIKPGNILINKISEPKLSDLGLARAVDKPDKYQTESGNLIGTPYYMSPEQYIDNKLVDHRSDMYSLGITFYQMVTGELPFNGDSIVDVMLKHLKEEPIPPSQINKNIDSSLSSIIMKLIQKDMEQRYQSYDVLISDLKNKVLSFVA
ncbi:MAG: serine/threonine-protein kinase [Candidatus Sericytochromatia bacterium]